MQLGVLGDDRPPARPASACATRKPAASARSAASSSPRSTTRRSSLEDVVEGGRLRPGDQVGERGVVVVQPDPPGPGRLDRPAHRDEGGRARQKGDPARRRCQRQARLARRGRQGAVHRAAAQGRGLAAGPEGRREEGRGTERPGLRADAARRQDRALLRPHRADRRHHRDGAAKTCCWAWSW